MQISARGLTNLIGIAAPWVLLNSYRGCVFGKLIVSALGVSKPIVKALGSYMDEGRQACLIILLSLLEINRPAGSAEDKIMFIVDEPSIDGLPECVTE